MTGARAFQAVLNEWQERVFRQAPREVMLDAVFEAAENVVVGGLYAPGTPKDTGFARASWWPSLNQEGVPLLPDMNPLPGNRAIGWTVTVIDGLATIASEFTMGDTIYLLSNCVYIEALEYGHSKQAPQGFIRLTVEQWQQIVDASVQKAAAALGG